MQPIHVRDPDEMPWVVGVPLLPWRPRWRGPGRPDPTATSDAITDGGARLGLETGGDLVASLFDDGPWFLVIAVVALVVAVPVLLFAVALALEVLVVLAVAAGVLLARVLLRRPFDVVAVAADGRRRAWPVRGLGAARAWAPEAADAIRTGADPVPPARPAGSAGRAR